MRLVVTRRRGEAVVIDGRIVVRVMECRGGDNTNRVRLAIDAPAHVDVVREELILPSARDSKYSPEE